MWKVWDLCCSVTSFWLQIYEPIVCNGFSYYILHIVKLHATTNTLLEFNLAKYMNTIFSCHEFLCIVKT